MFADMHVHSNFSVDGKSTMEDYCKIAVQKNVSKICFTEHVDFNEFELSRWKFNPEKYFKELNKMRIKYPNLQILSGIEFSEPHLFKEEFNSLLQWPFDNIIASIHHCNNSVFPSPKKFTVEQASKEYWHLMLDTVKMGGFQTLGHMDFPKRYFDYWIYDEEIINEILKIMVEKDIALEINTSSYILPNQEPLPTLSIIQRYSDFGGKKVVLGSDAHICDNLAIGFENVISLLPKNLKIGYYVNGEFKEL